MVQRIHRSSEGLSGKQDASQPQNARFFLKKKPNNEHSAELGVCSLYRRQKATARTQIQLRHETTSAPVPSRLTHTSLQHCFTILLSFRGLRKSTIYVLYMLILSVALSKPHIVAMFLNVACCVVTFLFDLRTKFQISSSRLIDYSPYTEN